jgi:hypothetical protein
MSIAAVFSSGNEKEVAMYCDRCGAQANQDAITCSSCGRKFGNVALSLASNRRAGHVRILGILWLALSAVRLIPGVGLIFIAVMGTRFLPPDFPAFVIGLVQGLIILLWINLVAGAITSWALLSHQQWARTAAIIVGVVNLWDLPFGAALGIYTLWVLLPTKSKQEYTEVVHGRSASAHV